MPRHFTHKKYIFGFIAQIIAKGLFLRRKQISSFNHSIKNFFYPEQQFDRQDKKFISIPHLPNSKKIGSKSMIFTIPLEVRLDFFRRKVII